MDLSTLAQQKQELLAELATLGDMRQGTLQTRMRKCSKQGCCCHTEGHPGHGPIYEFSGWEDGKRRVWNYKPGKELDALVHQVAAYQRFTQITKELITISSTIARLREKEHARTVEKTERKKKRQSSSARKSTRK